MSSILMAVRESHGVLVGLDLILACWVEKSLLNDGVTRLIYCFKIGWLLFRDLRLFAAKLLFGLLFESVNLSYLLGHLVLL